MKRADYRRQYADLNLEQLKASLGKLQDKYLQNIGICEANYQYYFKRFCYVKNRIEKLESKKLCKQLT